MQKPHINCSLAIGVWISGKRCRWLCNAVCGHFRAIGIENATYRACKGNFALVENRKGRKMKKIWYEIWMECIEPDDRLFGATPFDVAVAAIILVAIILIAR